MIADIADYIATETGALLPDIRCYVGELPTTAPAIALQLAGGGAEEQAKDTRRLMRLSLSVFARFASQKAALEALDSIQQHFCRRIDWQSTDDYQITSASASTLPNWIEQEKRGDYLYAMGMEVRYYERNNI